MAQFIAFLANPFPMQNNFLIGVKYALKTQCMCFLNKKMSVGNHEVACMKSVIYNELSQKNRFQSVPIAALYLFLTYSVKTLFLKNLSEPNVISFYFL